jgi:shikimate kinase
MFGMPIATVFSQHGEPAFRDAEVQVSQRFASQSSPWAVLSPGGGWVANVSAMAHLRPVSRIIYLRVTPSEAVVRLGAGISKRPLFAGRGAEAVMQELFDRRHAIYNEVADLVVETDGASSDEVLRRVLEQVGARWQ